LRVRVWGEGGGGGVRVGVGGEDEGGLGRQVAYVFGVSLILVAIFKRTLSETHGICSTFPPRVNIDNKKSSKKMWMRILLQISFRIPTEDNDGVKYLYISKTN